MNQLTIFREEALEHRFRRRPVDGDVLRISARWVSWTYWLLISVLTAGSTYVCVGRVNEYAEGIALIRDQGRSAVTPLIGGRVASIAVQPGERVEAQRVLLRFDDHQDRIELDHLLDEFKLLQISRLRNPNDQTVQQQMASARIQIATAERRLKEHEVLAPRRGIVRDIRIRPDQLVAPGELLLTIVDEGAPLSVVAILPGQYRPLLEPGSPLRMEVDGFKYSYQELTIDSVGNEAVGPNEIRRFLGQEIADGIVLEASSVIVLAHLQSREFEAQGQRHPYYDGMRGRAETRVRSERLLFMLAPGLKPSLEAKNE